MGRNQTSARDLNEGPLSGWLQRRQNVSN